MGTEWFRSVRYKAFLGIPREDPGPAEGTYGLSGLDRVLADAGVLELLRPTLDAHTINEPLHVSLLDRGFSNPNATPRILVIDVIQLQVDGGLNEIPRATCTVPIGRAIFDADNKRPSVIGGNTDYASASILHILEKHLTRHVPAKIHIRVETTATSGVEDDADNLGWPDEPMVLFDGIMTGPSHQAADSGVAVLHLTHFLAGLTFSSSLSGQVAAGGTIPAAFATGVWNNMSSGMMTAMTVYGAVAAGLAEGKALYTDFWGFQLPERSRVGGDGKPVRVPPNVGLKGFLTQLAETELFNWGLVSTADFGGSFCNNKASTQLKNNQALGALNRIEPIWPRWDLLGVGAGPVAGGGLGGAIAGSIWDSIEGAIGDAAGVDETPVDRSDLITRVGDLYGAAGYRYGMPISFYLTGTAQLAPFAMSRAFAQDITGATFADLNAASFWELLTSRYAGRYQIAVAPMADRAVVIPAAPVIEGAWLIVRRSEIFEWSDDIQMPVPVRGVMLASDRRSGTGAFLDGYRQFEAGYDSCQPGVFVTREMPAWLITAYTASGINAGNTVQFGAKNMATAPWKTSILAGIAGGGGAVGLRLGNPSTTDKSTAAKLAQSLWQQERLRYRSVTLSGRFRVDVAPGSTIIAELPSDKYVRESLEAVGEVPAAAQGLVVRVTHSIDCEANQASTSLQIGFVRLTAETAPGQPLYSARHPFWRTACYGAPWCDSKFFREALGSFGTIGEATLQGQQ